MPRVKKIQEPLETPEVLVTPESPVEAPEAPAPEVKEASAPDSVPAWFGEAFKSVTFDHKVWYVYASDGRRVSSAMSEDDAIRLVRGFNGR